MTWLCPTVRIFCPSRVDKESLVKDRKPRDKREGSTAIVERVTMVSIKGI